MNRYATTSVEAKNNTATNIVASLPTRVNRKRGPEIPSDEAAESSKRTRHTKAITLDSLGSYYPGYWINHAENSQGKTQEETPHTQVIAIGSDPSIT